MRQAAVLLTIIGAMTLFALRDLTLWQFFVEAPAKGLSAGTTATTDVWFDSLNKNKKYLPSR